VEIAQAREMHKPVAFISPADLGVRDVPAGPHLNVVKT